MTEKFCGQLDGIMWKDASGKFRRLDDGYNIFLARSWSDEFRRACDAKAATDALWPQQAPKPSLWRRFTYYAWRKWWYAYHEWLHRDCGRYS